MAIDWLGICHPSDFADIALCAPGSTTRSKPRAHSAFAPLQRLGALAAAGAARQSTAASAATSGGAILMPRNVATPAGRAQLVPSVIA